MKRAGPLETWDIMAGRMAMHGNRIALRHGDAKLSYTDILDHVQKAARRVEPDAGPNRRMLVENDPLALALDLMSCWAAGLSPMPARATLPIAQRERAHALLSAAPASRDETLIMSTSGSTGDAKLVAQQASCVRLNFETVSRDLGFSPDDRLLVPTSLSYSLGMSGALLPGLYAGCELHLLTPGAMPPALFRYIRAHEITVLQGPVSFHGFMRQFWSGEPMEHMRLTVQGGETLRAAITGWMPGAYPNARHVQIYGLTEAGPRVSHIDLLDPRAAQGCVGKPFEYIDCRIDNPDEHGVGTLELAGPSICEGYLSEDGYTGLGEDGFLRTSDAMSMNDDGSLVFHGRLNRCFKSAGKLLNPLSVERALLDIPGVEDAICGQQPHDVMGAVPVATVVPAANRDLTQQDIRRALKDLLEPFEIPVQINIVAAIPTTESRKRAV